MTTIDSGKVNIIADIKGVDNKMPGVDNKTPGVDNKIKDNNNNLVKKKRGRPQHLKTATTESDVHKLSIVGTRYEDIALVLGISNDTLTKHYKDVLEKGRIEANAAVAGTLYEKAKQGDTPSMIFWLKTRGQWSEKNTTELTGEGGMPINIKVVTGID